MSIMPAGASEATGASGTVGACELGDSDAPREQSGSGDSGAPRDLATHVALRSDDAAGPRSIAGAFLAMDGAAIFVHQERCAKVRNRNVTCLKCAQACTSGCISLVDDELVVDAGKCVGCGTCATVCPTCALEARNPSDAQLLAACVAARRGDEVTVACAQVVDGADARACAAAQVVCAGRVDESLLVDLVARGVRRVTVLCGACEKCPQRTGRATAELVAQTTELLLDAWGAKMGVDIRIVESSEPLKELVRVNVLEDGADAGGAGGGSSSAAVGDAGAAVGTGTGNLNGVAREAGHKASSPKGTAPLRVMRDGTLPHFTPDRRDRLLIALSRLGEPQAASLSCRLWGSVVIDGMKCVSCRMCATFCPTGAIVKFDDADGTMGVNHYPESCVKCGSCRDICPGEAIVLLDEVKTRYLTGGGCHRYVMKPRAVSLRNNPHQILDTMRLTFDGDLFER